MWIPMRKLLDAALVKLCGAAPPAAHTFAGAFKGLIRSPIAVDLDSDDSVTLTAEANYDGYSRALLGAESVPFVGQSSKSLISGTLTIWQPDGDDTVNTIYGQFILGSDSASVLAVEIFDDPIPLPDSGTGFADVPVFGLGPNAAGYGNSIITGQ